MKYDDIICYGSLVLPGSRINDRNVGLGESKIGRCDDNMLRPIPD